MVTVDERLALHETYSSYMEWGCVSAEVKKSGRATEAKR
jgi:hypothetical protein